MTRDQKIRAIQGVLEVTQDGAWGPVSQSAFDTLIHETTTDNDSIHRVLASSFADPEDVAKFRRCKAKGGSDEECFKVGDNGIGKWGDDCTGSTPMCALPPEDWQPFASTARGKKVLVTANNQTVVCELRDTMPHRANIHNGAGIDLSPAACRSLGLTPPVLIHAVWQWV